MTEPSETWVLRYSDGSGNGYRLERDPDHGARLSYDPVRPATSSSGIYDGGPALREHPLAEAEARALWQLAAALIADTRQHRTARAMGTGQLSWVRGSAGGSVILAPGMGQAFEARLRALIDGAAAPAAR